jgi:acylphosphatase
MAVRAAVRIVIRGRVQGVGYRAFVEREALRTGLDGWVRNRSDGSVEVVLAGPDNLVAKVIQACERGPFAARVDELDPRSATATEIALMKPGERFSVLDDAEVSAKE